MRPGSQDIIWISNDALGGFTINGRGFPATAPIVATLGDKIVIRFMNEGVMMHPWHLHGMPMRIVARDGYPLGPAAFTCDTLGVNPSERWDAVIECDEPDAWAFHCHVLTHAEGIDGMFGMVTALVVQPPAAAIEGMSSGGRRRPGGRFHRLQLPDPRHRLTRSDDPWMRTEREGGLEPPHRQEQRGGHTAEGNGFSDAMVCTVTEKARTLKCRDAGFEEE